MTLRDSYRQRRVLVTGGSGFLGGALLSSLAELQARVCVLSRTAAPDPAVGGKWITADLRDADAVRTAVDGVDLIFHLAAHSGSTTSNLEPFEDLAVNLVGDLTLLEAARRVDPHPRVVFPSSRLVYQPGQPLPVAETAATGPLSLYGVHKLAGEHYHLLYRHLYALPAVVLRITNAYGPSRRPAQSRYGIVNWFVHLALAGEVIPIYGDGGQLRDYVHVDDVVQAMLLAGSAAAADGAILNVGSGQAISLAAMAETAVAAAGRGRLEQRPWPPEAALVETGDFVAEVSRAAAVLGWRPTIRAEDGIARLVRQYRQMERAF